MLPIDDNGWLGFFGRLYIWSTLAAIVFGALALLASNGIRVFSERIGRVQNKQIADANERASKADERAGEANKQAGLAHERAAKLETRASEAEAETKRAEAEAAKANTASHEAVAKVSTAEARIAEAEARALEAKLALEKFKAPRTLSKEQQDRIVAKLKPFIGQQVSFSVYPDPESIALSRVIVSMLQSAGWTKSPSQIGDIEIEGSGVIYDTGVRAHIAPADIESTIGALNAFVSALTAEGIDSEGHRTDQLTGKRAKTINIAVGRKP